MHVSNHNHACNNEIQQQTLKETATKPNIANPNITATPLSYRQLFSRSVRQLAYRYQTGYKNELMSAEEFKSKLCNHEKFCPDIRYVVYVDIPKEEEVYTIPSISLGALYCYLFDPKYMGTLDLSDLSDAEFNNLPNCLHVKGSVKLSKSNICKLPEEFIVDYNLYISECSNLTELPEKLYVDNLLDAHQSGIKNLNSKFNACLLDVSKCIDLKEIPEEPLNVYGHIDFSDCPNIKNMPNWITSITRAPTNNRLRKINLRGTAISYDTVQNSIEEFKKANMQRPPDVEIFFNDKDEGLYQHS